MDVSAVLGMVLVAVATLSLTFSTVSHLRRRHRLHHAEATLSVYRYGMVGYGDPSTVTFGCAQLRQWHDSQGRVVHSEDDLVSALTLPTEMIPDVHAPELEGCDVRLMVPTKVQPGDVTRCEVYLLDGRVRVVYLDPGAVHVYQG